MRKQELAALWLKSGTFQDIVDTLPSHFGTLSIAIDAGARDGEFAIEDYGARGCVIMLASGELAQRVARALAPKAGAKIPIYVVTGTNSGTKFKFRAAAYEATPDGHLRDASGVELDFEDEQQQWGGGSLDARTRRVMHDFGALPALKLQSKYIGYKRQSVGKPSSPRVATLMALLKKARTWDGHPIEGGRVELKVELAAGGRQSSFCSAAEFEELKKLTGR